VLRCLVLKGHHPFIDTGSPSSAVTVSVRVFHVVDEKTDSSQAPFRFSTIYTSSKLTFRTLNDLVFGVVRIETGVLAAALAALLANTYARTLPPTSSFDNHLDVLTGRAPVQLVIPEPKPEPKPEPEPAPGAPGASEALGRALKVLDGPAHLSIPESGLPKSTATRAESVAPTTGPAESNAPTATQAKSVAPSATEPKPVAPTGPAQGSDDDNSSAPCKRGIFGVRCALDRSDDSEPVGARSCTTSW
jgi:hypothetical protein